MKLGFAIAVLTLGISLPALAKDHAADYQVGFFSSTGQFSDGSFAYCSGAWCQSGSASHNIHYVRTNDGMYAIQAPISVGKSMLLGMLAGPAAPMIHKEWFMDQLHEGDQMLFAPKCNKHNNCEFWLPDPDNAGKEYATIGFYRADVSKTNTTSLCGKGRLSPAVEAQVCVAKLPKFGARPAYAPSAPTSAPAVATAAPTPVSSTPPAVTTAANTRPTSPPVPAANPNQRGPATNEKW